MNNNWKRGILMFVFLFPFILHIFRLLHIAFDPFSYVDRGFFYVAEPFTLSTVDGFVWAGILALFFSLLFALTLRGVEKKIVSNKSVLKWSFKFYGSIYLFYVLLWLALSFWGFGLPSILINAFKVSMLVILNLFFSHLSVLIFLGIYNHIKIRKVVFWVAIILSLVLYGVNIYLFSSCNGWHNSYCMGNKAYLKQDASICEKGYNEKIIDFCGHYLKERHEGAERKKNLQNI